jgi:hypothetical protein
VRRQSGRLRAQEQTRWRTQIEMAEFSDAMKQNTSLQLKNIFGDWERDAPARVKQSLTVQIDGKREVLWHP